MVVVDLEYLEDVREDNIVGGDGIQFSGQSTGTQFSASLGGNYVTTSSIVSQSSLTSATPAPGAGAFVLQVGTVATSQSVPVLPTVI